MGGIIVIIIVVIINVIFIVRCVICGVQIAMDQVLRNMQAGGHLIIITRGDDRTLSKDDEEIIADYDKYYNIRCVVSSSLSS